MKEKRALFVLTSHGTLGDTGKPTGWWLAEAAHPWKVLFDNGYTVDFVSPQGGEPPMTGVDLNDPIAKEFLDNPAIQHWLKNTLTPEKVDPSLYLAIFYVGGHGAMWDFPNNKPLQDIAVRIYENGGVVGAVCHGPAGLVNIKLSTGDLLVSSKQLTCFSDSEEIEVGLQNVVPFLLQDALVADGGVYIGAPNWSVNVQSDKRLVTGQNPQSATKVGEELVKLMASLL